MKSRRKGSLYLQEVPPLTSGIPFSSDHVVTDRSVDSPEETKKNHEKLKIKIILYNSPILKSEQKLEPIDNVSILKFNIFKQTSFKSSTKKQIIRS